MIGKPDRNGRPMQLLSTQEAAARLGLTRRAVRLLVANGTLPATRVGRVLAIRPADLARAAGRRKPGRPKALPNVEAS